MVQTHDIATVYNLERHGTFSKKNNGHIMVFWDIFLYNKLFLLHWNNRIIHLGFKPQIACVFGIIFDIIRLLWLILYDIGENGAHTLGEKYNLSIRWQKECSRLKSIKTVLFHYILHYEAIKELLFFTRITGVHICTMWSIYGLSEQITVSSVIWFCVWIVTWMTISEAQKTGHSPHA